jgi:hypothetical protein
MINLKSLPLVIAIFIFVVCMPLGFIRLGADVWSYYHPVVAGSPRVFHDHHELGIVLMGVILSAIFGAWFWFAKD